METISREHVIWRRSLESCLASLDSMVIIQDSSLKTEEHIISEKMESIMAAGAYFIIKVGSQSSFRHILPMLPKLFEI